MHCRVRNLRLTTRHALDAFLLLQTTLLVQQVSFCCASDQTQHGHKLLTSMLGQGAALLRSACVSQPVGPAEAASCQYVNVLISSKVHSLSCMEV
jgi:hypothetical protein